MFYFFSYELQVEYNNVAKTWQSTFFQISFDQCPDSPLINQAENVSDNFLSFLLTDKHSCPSL